MNVMRNNVLKTGKLPANWSPGKFDPRSGKWIGRESAENIRWVASLGNTTYGSPVLYENYVFCATNNHSGYIERYPSGTDLGVLLAFEADTGKMLWQFSCEKLDDTEIDWPEQGICSNPVVEGDKLWIMSNRCEIVCIPLKQDSLEAKPLWTYDMIKELDVMPHHASSCSPLLIGDYVFSLTSNGVDAGEKAVVKPNSPSFIALHKETGKLVWSDVGPGERTLDGQWGSPAALEKNEDGLTQIVFPGGDGWLYTIGVKEDGTIRKLWKFDCNPKESIWRSNTSGDRNFILSTPVIADGLIYVATGRDPEAGEGKAVLRCIDPGKFERKKLFEQFEKDSDNYLDLSENLAKDKAPGAAEDVRANPDSIALWSYFGRDPKSKEFEDTFRRTLGSVVIADGLLFIGDFSGVLHCLNAKTGEVYWTYDVMSTIWGTGLAADGRLFLGDTDGDVAIFKLSKEFELLEEINLGDPIYGAPGSDGKRIYIATCSNLFCIEDTE